MTVGGNGGFTAQRLLSAPAVDGKDWLAVNVIDGVGTASTQAIDRKYSLTVRESAEVSGDLVRYEVYLQDEQRAPVRIDENLSAWAYATPDGHYVFTEPLDALDVRQWQRYRLDDVLGIRNYTVIEAISRDCRRLLVSRRDCAFDCGAQPVEYYELTLPN
jgi:hypothetical protein